MEHEEHFDEDCGIWPDCLHIAFVNQKGGVGKSSLAVHAAVYAHEVLGCKVLLIDCDIQGSSTKWIGESEWAEHIDVEPGTDVDDIIDLASTQDEIYDVIISDGPGGLGEITRGLFFVADVAVIPVGASHLDIESAAPAIKQLKSATTMRDEGPHPMIVLNKVRAGTTLTREAQEVVKTLGVPVCEHMMPLREPIADTPGQRTVAWKLGTRAKNAAAEMKNVIASIIEYGTEKNPDLQSVGRATLIPQDGGSSNERQTDADFEQKNIANA